MENLNAVKGPFIDRKINYQFKLLYAIGIFFVVAGHAGGEEFIFLHELMHCAGFYLAMFVFASGYFYDRVYDSMPGEYILKKLKKFFIPYILWNLFYGFLVFILSKFGFTIGMPITLVKLTYKPLLGIPLFSYNSPSWFVIPFLLTEVYNACVRRILLNVSENVKNIGLMSFNLFLGLAGIYLAKKGISSDIQLFFTRFMYFVPFYYLGYIYHIYLEKKDVLSNFWYFTILIALELVIILINGHSPYYLIMDMRDFSDPFTPYLVGILGIAFWLRVSRILAPAIGKSKYIVMVANNTFAIMMHHFLGFTILGAMFYIASKFISVLPKFDIEAFMNSSDYIYMPRGRGFPLLYTIFGIAFSILLQYAVLEIKMLICRNFSRSVPQSLQAGE